ncbi:hypothetical protein [Streptomyces sp. DH8]
MALSKARTKEETVNIALRFYAEQQERAARLPPRRPTTG